MQEREKKHESAKRSRRPRETRRNSGKEKKRDLGGREKPAGEKKKDGESLFGIREGAGYEANMRSRNGSKTRRKIAIAVSVRTS